MSKNIGTQQRAEFYKIFKEQIVPVLRNYEVYRKKEYTKFIFSILLIIFVALPGMWILYLLSFGKPIIIAGMHFTLSTDFAMSVILSVLLPSIVFIPLVFYPGYIYRKNKKFKLTLKTDCLTRILNIFGDMEWKNESQKDKSEKTNWISDDSLNECGLFIPFNTRNTDDEFKGAYQGIDYKISETQLLDCGTRHCIKIFKGIVIRFKYNKNIKNRTIVATKWNITKKNTIGIWLMLTLLCYVMWILKHGFNWFELILAGIFALMLYIDIKNKMKKEEPLNKVTLEDTKFNKKFNVYSSDQVEARYLVTPSFMERLYNLQTSFGAKTIKCSFYKDYLMIAISTGQDLFELGDLFHPLLDANSHIKLFRDLYSILHMIEYFKLDEKVSL